MQRTRIKKLSLSRRWRQIFKRYSMRMNLTFVLVLVVINICIYFLWNYYQPNFTLNKMNHINHEAKREVDDIFTDPEGAEFNTSRGLRYFNRFSIRKKVSKKCSKRPTKLIGGFNPDLIAYHWHVIESKHSTVSKGHWSPDCKAKQRVAIIIPYRNRVNHIKVLINNLHYLLQRQERDYGIFVVEQMPGTSFNRAMLFNIGFRESLKWYDFNCFVFHDVDLIPENDHNLYQCGHDPIHLSAYIDKFSYKLPYEDLFGGVSAINIKLFRSVNGFSNFYFGWGGEDDDMSKRLRYQGCKIFRYPNMVGAYKMIKHRSDSGNPANTWRSPDSEHNYIYNLEISDERFALVKTATIRMQKDGLNSLEYEVVSAKVKRLMIWIQIQVEEEKMKLNYSIWIKQDFLNADLSYQLKVIVVALMLFISSLFIMCFIVICAIKVTPDFHQPLLSNKILLIEKSCGTS